MKEREVFKLLFIKLKFLSKDVIVLLDVLKFWVCLSLFSGLLFENVVNRNLYSNLWRKFLYFEL